MADSSSAGDADNVVALRDDERDERILQLRLAGVSIRRLSREFKMPERHVLDVLDAMLPKLSPENRVRMFREDVARIDELLVQHYAAARSGSINSSQLVIRLLERRSSMVGYDVPLSARVAVEVIQHSAVEREGSTALLLAELDRIAAEQDSSGLVIEGEIAEPDPAA